MKKILVSILTMLALCVSVYASEAVINSYVKQLENLTKEQKKIMLYSYRVGEPEDLGYSLAAIAWKESMFGKYMLNLADGRLGSFGVYHILLEYAIARARIKDDWNTSRLAERLMYDLDFSAKEAIGELKFWKNYFRKNKYQWKSMFAAYNAGTAALKSKKGKQYADDAVLRVKALERYFEKHDPLKTKSGKAKKK